MKDLLCAIEASDCEKVRMILSKNPELLHHPECKDNNGASILWKAMLENRVELVELLIQEFGANPNELCGVKDVFYYEFTFVQYAASCAYSLKKLEMFEVLIRHRASVNIFNDHNETPVKSALSKGNRPFVELLLKNKARLEGPEWEGKSPAAFAFDIKDDLKCDQMLQLLIKYGLDVNFRNEDDENLLHTLIGYEELPGRRGNNIKIAETLLDAGVPLNEVENAGYSPLLCAINTDDTGLAVFLIKKGADVNMIGNDVFPLFMASSSEDLVNVIKELITAGAEINAKDPHGWTALHSACHHDKVEIISLLIEKGADINVVDKYGDTPLKRLFKKTQSENNHRCLTIMIKEIAKRKYFNDSFVCDLNMKLIQADSKSRDYLENCTNELSQMANTKLCSFYTYLSVLKMPKNISMLKKFGEKRTNFRRV